MVSRAGTPDELDRERRVRYLRALDARYLEALARHEALLEDAPCGSDPGWRRHRLLGETPCEPCTKANALVREVVKLRESRHRAEVRRVRRVAPVV